MPKELDITGNRYGNLICLGKTGSRSGSGVTLWQFECDCGNKFSCSKHHIIKNSESKCKDCAILVRAQSRQVHGRSMARSSDKTYRAWCKIKERCFNSNTESYKYYDGLELKMEPKWVNSFQDFLDHVGDPEEEGMSIDRIDNSKGYIVGNIQWATPSQQARNKGLAKSSKTGVTGVSYSNVGPKGRYVSSWTELLGKLKCKYFSINKYGEELAFFMACEYREQQINLLNLQGAGYNVNHGKGWYSGN